MAKELHGRVIGGIILVIFGILLFIKNYEPFEYILPSFIFQWEFIFMIVGFLFFFLSRNKIPGIIFFSIGLFNLIPELWPLVFVIIGLFILFNDKRKRYSYNQSNTNPLEKGTNYFEQISIFGGGSKVFTSDNFKGGNIISIFGGSEVNLLGSKLANGENVLETISIFGGTTILVPNDWNIVIDVLPIFGAFNDKRFKNPNDTIDKTKTLIIKGIAIFGGGEVKSVFN